MPPRLPFLVPLALISALAPACAGEATMRGNTRPICPEDAPEGVRLAPQPGCGARAPRPAAGEREGFHDLGGVKLRVSGRVSAEYGLSR